VQTSLQLQGDNRLKYQLVFHRRLSDRPTSRFVERCDANYGDHRRRRDGNAWQLRETRGAAEGSGQVGYYAFMAVSAALRLSKDLSGFGNLESSSLW